MWDADDDREQPFKIDKYALIGNSGIRTELWYEISEEGKKNLPFGNHVEEDERKSCKEIILITDFYESSFEETTRLSLHFFIDSRKCGIGGNIAAVVFKTGAKSFEEGWKELVEKAEVVLSKLQLKISKEKLSEKITDDEESIKALNKEIEFLKQLES